ncbi:hypothetical protein AC1031_014818 [Aphanomyces cochlioides]|nr:hypothetical protein AC1031_014801 [Aphanomyces cochlioides]KAG9398202.1 hypothetical protein AC1031_014803 [Aphanomyces cochlioides]KAG9398205.1 hypothetical protein AC1031_014806 [Aphanomyces cochlioides]KAG9398207.1 hypothetical protein AC1031_014808 [Aphanomyces cochlioides]KAG9398209.1 hypothetical protein AC1031_014810 [Aphanomyces cochlioides]
MQLVVWAISTLLALGVVAQSPATTATPTTTSPTDVTSTSPLTQESAVDGLTTDVDNRQPGGDDIRPHGDNDNRHHEYDSGDPRSSRGSYAEGRRPDYGPIGGPMGPHDGGHNGYYYGSNDGYGSQRNNRGYGYYRV